MGNSHAYKITFGRKKMKPNIMEVIVANDKCIGCGVCAAICPAGVLTMDLNNYGIYQPLEMEGCLEQCSFCLEVCPFVEGNLNEKELATKYYATQSNIKKNQGIGYFLDTYEVHKIDESDRLKSASGGAGHWFLTSLIEKGEIDCAITVEPCIDSEKLFKFSIFKSVTELDNSRGSAYYPTELADVLKHVLNNDGSYAITALPCFAKAIRLAQERSPKLRKRIRYVIGLVCGQMKNKYFTEELGRVAIGKDRLQSVNYRVKQVGKSANNFAFEFTNIRGKEGRLDRSGAPNHFWGTRVFTPLACNFCTDVFAETADVVLMDAWLPEYSKDYRGHTLVLIRSNELNIHLAQSKVLNISVIQARRVFNSQRSVVINKKAFARKSWNPILRLIVSRKKYIQELSQNDCWVDNRDEIEDLIINIAQYEKVRKFLFLPKRAIMKIYKKILRL